MLARRLETGKRARKRLIERKKKNVEKALLRRSKASIKLFKKQVAVNKQKDDVGNGDYEQLK